MSRFFRSPNSTDSADSSSGPDDSDSQEERRPSAISSNTNDLPNIDVLPENARSSVVDRASADLTAQHRDFLLHSLLEERCMNEVLSSYNSTRRPSRDSPHVQAEANAKYQRLCAQLASYNLISTGLEGDQHLATRKRYRDGLNVLGQQRSAAVVPQPIQRLLTDHDTGVVEEIKVPSGTFETNGMRSISPLRKLLSGSEHSEEHKNLHLMRTLTNTIGKTNFSPTTSILRNRYHHEFEELGALGRGGYGTVYCARHRLDNQIYAVKKVPISSARLQEIQKRGEAEIEEVLRELRTLASLDHPNIVRYFNGWIEWIDNSEPSALSQSQANSMSGFSSQVSHQTRLGAEDWVVGTTGRMDAADSLGDASIVFERSTPTAAQETPRTSVASVESASVDYQLRRIGTRSTIGTASDEPVEYLEQHDELFSDSQSVKSDELHFTKPTLALHMQMAMYPISLSDFLLPSTTAPLKDPHVAMPLKHCFHVEPSISILLAILQGTEYLHDNHIVHRDLKPANIFLRHIIPQSGNNSGVRLCCTDCDVPNTQNVGRLEVRIGDFGLVAVANPGSSAPPPTKAVGTEIYRRQSAATAPHPSLDIYALGIIAFELLYKFDTKMERQHTIQHLKQGEFPEDFGKIWSERTRLLTTGCIGRMLGLYDKAASIPELRRCLRGITTMRRGDFDAIGGARRASGAALP